MSANLEFYDLYQFETYINGFLEFKFPNFDPKHGILNSIEAGITVVCRIRQSFSCSAFYIHPLTFQGESPSKFE